LPKLTVQRALPKSAFELEVPNGFEPFALDYTPGGIATGKPFPMSGWRKSGRDAAIPKSKPQLVAVLDEESEPSARVLPFLRTLGLPLTIISNATKPSLIPDAYVDPTGQILRELDIQGTPMLYLLDSTGVIRGMWMGFDGAKSAELASEIKAVAGSAK
jgi:hypothetical protein